MRRKTDIRPRDAMRSKTLWLVLVLATGCLWAQEKKEEQTPPAEPASTEAPAAPHPATITAEDKARKNPVKFTEVSVEHGKKIYSHPMRYLPWR